MTPKSAPKPKPERKRYRSGAELLADGVTFFDVHQACAKLGVSMEVLEQHTSKGNLTPAPLNGAHGLVYTARDLKRFKAKKIDREKHIIDALEKGLAPIDAYYEAHAQDSLITLRDVIRVTHTYAEIAGLWIVAGPPGSYARWLERMGLVKLKAVHLRRIIEALLLDPHVARVARLKLDEMRSKLEQVNDPEADASASEPLEPAAQ